LTYLKEGSDIPKKGRGAKLSGKMTLFVDHYTNPDSTGFKKGSESVRLAGYKHKPGNENRIAVELMNHPLVSAEINRRFEDRQKKLELTAEYVIEKLVDIVEESEKDTDRIRSLELLGKSLGLFKDRQEISGPDGEAIQMEQKINERAADFTSKLSRLAATGGATGIAQFPKRSREGETES